MIFVGVGSNIPAKGYSSPKTTIEAAVKAFDAFGIALIKVSKFYTTSPVPSSNQPWFVNCVVQVNTKLNPIECMTALLEIESMFQRERSVPNAKRTLDLDLLDYMGLITPQKDRLILPHPRMNKRAFVLAPLSDICANWVCPKEGKKIDELIKELPSEQIIKCLID
jgi:2-amino-4-hydroxy-6-hydroxymethyldihydropteridine diphosphokinase